MADIRVADYEAMQTLIKNGREAGFNRQIPQDLQDSLDPEGMNIVQYFLPHEHIAGEKVDPHVRVGVFLKLKDDDSPNAAIMDVSYKDWEALPFAKP